MVFVFLTYLVRKSLVASMLLQMSLFNSLCMAEWCGGLVVKSFSDSCDPIDPFRLLCPWDSPGRNPEAGCHFLFQGIFPIQELNPGLLHCRGILYQLSYEVSPVRVSSSQLHVCMYIYTVHRVAKRCTRLSD